MLEAPRIAEQQVLAGNDLTSLARSESSVVRQAPVGRAAVTIALKKRRLAVPTQTAIPLFFNERTSVLEELKNETISVLVCCVIADCDLLNA